MTRSLNATKKFYFIALCTICNNISGHNHLCITDEECVEGAICQEVQDKHKPANLALLTNPNDPTTVKTCQCVDGTPTSSGKCGGKLVRFLNTKNT